MNTNNTNSTNSAWCVGSPTEFTELTEPSAWDVLPQNPRNSQKLLLEISSHRLHGFTQMLLTSGGALVSARLCRLPEQEVHQPSKNGLPACEI